MDHAERWRPFRSVASWYMWRAVDMAKNESLAAKAKAVTRPRKKASTG